MNTALSVTIRKQLRNKRLSLGWLAHQCGSTYEHMRKLANSEAYPSKLMLKAMCAALELDFNEMAGQVTRDRVRRKYGIEAATTAPKHELLVQLEELWPVLDEQVRISLLNFAKASLPPLRYRNSLKSAGVPTSPTAFEI